LKFIFNPDVSENGEVLNYQQIDYTLNWNSIRESMEIIDYKEFGSIWPLPLQKPNLSKRTLKSLSFHEDILTEGLSPSDTLLIIIDVPNYINYYTRYP
jgi:hypothetical protein